MKKFVIIMGIFIAVFLVFTLVVYVFYLNSRESNEELLAILNNPAESASDRASAALELGSREEPRAIDPTLRLLEDENTTIQSFAARALCYYSDPKIVQPLSDLLKEGIDITTTEMIIQTLGRIGTPEAAAAIVPFLLDKHYHRNAAAALDEAGWQPETKEERVHYYVAKGDIEHLLAIWDETKEVLLNEMDSEDSTIQEYAFTTLIRFDNEDIIHALIEKLNSKGDKTMALDYLNCGIYELEEAAKQWAEKNGYYIVPSYKYESGSDDWGSW